jgi:hypothetical protein
MTFEERLTPKRVNELRERLAHVLWIGGSPCSGKSSIAELLSNKLNYQVYHCDEAFPIHAQNLVPVRYPTFHKVTRMSWDEIWMRPLEELVADEIQVYREEFEMILDDLLAMPGSTPVLAEGTALLPDLVADLIPDPDRAVWIVPTEQFQRKRYAQRGPWVQDILSQCADPQVAFKNWMDRDVAFGRRLIEQTRELNLYHLIVDSRRSITENAAIVQKHFHLS